MRFVQQARLGYDREHVVAVDISFSDVLAKYEVLKSAFLTGTSVTGVAASSQLPVNVQTGENIDVEGGRSLGVNCLSVDPDFFSVMGMELVAGSDLIRGIRPNDTLNYFVLNESALASLGWQPENALVQSMSIRHGNQKPGPVMGVVRDFHYQSLHHEVGPLAIEFNPASYQYLLVRMKGDDIAGTIDFLRERWKEVTGPTPMSYQFLDDKYDELYKSESRTGSLLLTFTAVALLIALLGLFGLSSFAVERRTKEMSIRKVMGAGATQVLGLFSGEIIVLTLAALVLAVPAGYYVMNQWMSSFAYRAPVSLWMFIIAGAFNFLLALGTVVYHGLRVSRVNPASILKYE
jgi:putative ABC transport system permease protein